MSLNRNYLCPFIHLCFVQKLMKKTKNTIRYLSGMYSVEVVNAKTQQTNTHTQYPTKQYSKRNLSGGWYFKINLCK